jgi:hypothetical protein
MRTAVKITAAGALMALIFLVVAYSVWDPGPSTSQCFDKGTNGIWIGHQWYSGYNVRTGAPVSIYERDELLSRLRRSRIRYVFIHAGPVKSDGTIDDMPGPFFDTLKRLSPDIVYLPWIGGKVDALAIADPCWRRAFLQTLGRLRSAGFSGVHLDFEPLADFHPGYCELLSDIRTAFEGDFFISHATRLLNTIGVIRPFLDRHFWTPAFYRACMRLSDQTVLMGYDTRIMLRKVFIAFIRYQTVQLLSCASAVPGHRVMIGVPSYDDVPHLSDPRVENIKNGVCGIRAGLEEDASLMSVFDGVALYAYWTTQAAEWKHYEAYWLNRLN